MRKKIALYANVFETTVGQSITYMDFFGKFGEVVLAHTEADLDHIIKTCDILALPGGADVYSGTYKTVPGFSSIRVNPHYEYLDDYLLMPWLKTEKPIVAICRGMQVLNVRMGGTLHTNLYGHVQDDRKGRDETPEIMFTELMKGNTYRINSYHHQGVYRVAEGFRVLGWGEIFLNDPAYTLDDVYRNVEFVKAKDKATTRIENQPMVPEIMAHTDLPYIAFQYHPEEFNCWLATELIQKTLKQKIQKSKYA